MKAYVMVAIALMFLVACAPVQEVPEEPQDKIDQVEEQQIVEEPVVTAPPEEPQAQDELDELGEPFEEIDIEDELDISGYDALDDELTEIEQLDLG